MSDKKKQALYLPCEIGDTIYQHTLVRGIVPCIVNGFLIDKTGTKLLLTDIKINQKSEISIDEIGKTIFLERAF